MYIYMVCPRLGRHFFSWAIYLLASAIFRKEIVNKMVFL